MRSNFAWTLAGSGVYGASQWGMLIVLAKFGSAEMLGRFALALAICAPVVMFTNLQLRNVQATDARGEYCYREYLSLRLISSALALAVIAAVAFAAGYRFEVTAVVLVIGLAKAVESVSDVVYGRLQKCERLDRVATSMMIRGPAALAALLVLILWTGNVVLGAAGVCAAWAAVLLGYDLANARRVTAPEPRGEDDPSARFGAARGLASVGRLAWLSLPLGIVGLLDSLNVNAPRYLVERSLGEAALGHFAALAYVVVAGNMVVGALAQSAAPRLSRSYVGDIGEFKRLVWKLVQFGALFGLMMLLAAVLFGRTVLTVLYTSEYAVHAKVFAWLMVAAGVGYIARFLVCSMTAARYFKAQAPLYAVALLILLILSLWLIPSHGLLGAAWAICVGMLALLLGSIAVNVCAVRARSTLGRPRPTSLGARVHTGGGEVEVDIR